jgi:hypothetical protein
MKAVTTPSSVVFIALTSSEQLMCQSLKIPRVRVMLFTKIWPLGQRIVELVPNVILPPSTTKAPTLAPEALLPVNSIWLSPPTWIEPPLEEWSREPSCCCWLTWLPIILVLPPTCSCAVPGSMAIAPAEVFALLLLMLQSRTVALMFPIARAPPEAAGTKLDAVLVFVIAWLWLRMHDFKSRDAPYVHWRYTVVLYMA